MSYARVRQSTPVQSRVAFNELVGQWKLYARRPGRSSLEISYVRGVPTKVGAWTLADPFGPQSITYQFPKVTIFDQLGVGDLDWLHYGADIDLVYDGPLRTGYPGGAFAVEGFAVSFEYSADGLTVAVSGAMLQLDNYLAKPEYPSRPLPYELAISRHFTGRPDLRLKPLKIEFPSSWYTTYVPPPKETRLYLLPTGVKKGQKWTGLTTRQTGSWDPALTSYIQTLLTSMYTDRGRWTLDLDPGRQPVLRHRTTLQVPEDGVLVLDPATPGVDVSLSVDYSQSLNVAYGQGTSLAGEGYTGQVITTDGQRTEYTPLAALRQVDPPSDVNGWLDTSRMRKEVNLQVQPGLSLSQARQVAASHLRQYTDPGFTGTITLTADVPYRGGWLSRFLIKAGMSVHLPGLFGAPDGALCHITEVTADMANGTVQLNVDSKFRDALTSAEVRLRGRDALQVSRQLIGGQYQPAVPDLTLPWNYAEGSGYIPSGPHHSSQRLFEEMPSDIVFPWEEWTTQRPPRDASWRTCYMGIGPKKANADLNWAVSSSATGSRLAFPVKMAQAGTIRRLEVAAYDAYGNVLPVRFHLSLYASRGTSVSGMPQIVNGPVDGYASGQHYPFFDGAWEKFRADGSQVQTEQPLAKSSVGLQRAWGTRFIPAGFWPGSPLSGDAPTGLLVDEGQFDFDTTSFDANFSPYVPQQVSQLSGYLYVMIYCDEQIDQPVFFMGRCYRTEPGASV